MTKQELVLNVSHQTGVNQDVVEKVINATMEVTKQALFKGRKIYLRGFGTWLPRERNAQLFARNIILTCNLETIAEDPQSPEAQHIIKMYKHKLDQRREREQATQN